MAQDDTFGMTRADPGQLGDLDQLASHVITVLCERQTRTATGVRQFVHDYILRAVLRPTDFHTSDVINELRGYRLATDAIIDAYIPAAAMELGEMWKRSEIDFAQVTVATMRLQSLLGEASAELHFHSAPSSHDLSALVVICEGEQHFLGASVVSAQLRRLGCHVGLSFCDKPDVVAAKIKSDEPDMVLFSCARIEALEVVAQTVTTIRAKVKKLPVLALGGAISGDAQGIIEKTGVELVSHEARDVVSFCSKRLKALSRK